MRAGSDAVKSAEHILIDDLRPRGAGGRRLGQLGAAECKKPLRRRRFLLACPRKRWLPIAPKRVQMYLVRYG